MQAEVTWGKIVIAIALVGDAVGNWQQSPVASGLLFGAAALTIVASDHIRAFSIMIEPRNAISAAKDWVARGAALLALGGIFWVAIQPRPLTLIGWMLDASFWIVLLASLWFAAPRLKLAPVSANNPSEIRRLGERMQNLRTRVNEMADSLGTNFGIQNSYHGADPRQAWEQRVRADQMVAQKFDRTFGHEISEIYSVLAGLGVGVPFPPHISTSHDIAGTARYLGAVGQMLTDGRLGQARQLSNSDIWQMRH